MASLAERHVDPVTRDRLFFFIMSVIVAAVTLSGFLLQFAAGRSTLGAPWWVHLHGVTMVGWLSIYVCQNWLVWRGQVAAHRKLGWIATIFVGWVLIAGLLTPPATIAAHRVPAAFSDSFFLMMDWLNVVWFAGMVWAGVLLRRATDWHRRLILGSAFIVMLPGIGRLSLLLDRGPIALFGMILPLWLAAVIYDWITRGRPHPAYAWGFGAFVLMIAITDPLAQSAPVQAFTHYLAG